MCSDAQLRIGFSATAKAGKSGKIQVWQTIGMDGGAPVVVDSIDMADGGYSKKVGGKSFFYWPVVFEGNVATIILHAPLPVAGTYHISVDDGQLHHAVGRQPGRQHLPGVHALEQPSADDLGSFGQTV